jgi:hypothetical protein
MSSKSKKMRPEPESAGGALETLPDVDSALMELTRRQIRVGVALVVRIVAVALVTTVLAHQIPAMARMKPLVDALSGVLVLWPFFTAYGKLQAWRIALGRSYAKAERWADAERTLLPLDGLRGSVYDATGEGRYWLAVARRGLGRKEEARRLFIYLATLPGGEWAERARQEAAIAGISEPSGVKS